MLVIVDSRQAKFMRMAFGGYKQQRTLTVALKSVALAVSEWQLA